MAWELPFYHGKDQERGGFEMSGAKKWIDRLDRWMIAITFAEAGEKEMALDALNEKPKKRRVGFRIRRHTEQRPVLRA